MSTFDAMALRQEIRRARRALDMTQQELADKLVEAGFKSSQAQIASYENGSVKPSLDKLDAIASALGGEWKLK
ncbi:helix-turn-helix transcriptional regulator [Leeuwenhoekiella aequorea]|uniref:helix-turn-helix domain-containing protein n=1 Tax=Leeuwenhoekiella aequorea TaxID=283736 RepID=UPI00352D6787|tara:strand:+ start:3945 stop:4163 length:219 start_codon:yes stop_codon:yes gene_type:complete